MAAEAAAAAAGAGPLGAIMGGLGLLGSVTSLFGARSARKKQERFIKKMMADRAARIAEAKGEYDKSRRGLQAENRGAMLAALKGVPASLGASLMQGSTAANAMRSIYADAQRRSAEIGRQTAAGKAELAMLSPYDIVDPSTMGQSRGAEMQALSGVLSGFGQLAGGLMSRPSDPYSGGTVTGYGGQQYRTGFNEGTNSYMSMPTSGVMPGQLGSMAWSPGKTLSPTLGGFDARGYGPQYGG